MKQIESFEKNKGKLWIIYLMLFLVIAILIIWFIFISYLSQLSIAKCIILNIFFSISYLALLLLIWEITKVLNESNERRQEFFRKIQWDEFQYQLYENERNENKKYEAVKSLIDKLDNKIIKDDNPIKEEINKLRQDFDEWKLKKDKQFFVEISNKLKTTK